MWQKLVPLVVLGRFVIGGVSRVLMVVGCLGRVVGGVGGFFQTQVRVLLGYSSINHGGWLIVGRVYGPVGCVCYFLIYGFLVGLLFYLLRVVELVNFEVLVKGFRVFSVKFLGLLVLLLVRLAGLPPMLGFAMK